MFVGGVDTGTNINVRTNFYIYMCMGERINIHAHTYIYTHVYTHIFGIFLTPQRDTSCSFLSSNLYSPSLLSKSSNQHSDFHHHSLLSPILKFHIIELYSVYAFVASFFHSVIAMSVRFNCDIVCSK